MTNLLRNVAVTTILRVLRVTLGVLSRVIPQSRSVVLSVFPATEGNGLEVARALLERYAGRVVWLAEAGPLPAEVRTLASDGMVLVPKASARGVLAYLRAQAVFFTHGLYGSPRPCRRKPIVNLWHGDGPKDVRPDNGVGGLISSTYFVGSTRLFSDHQAEGFGVPAERLLLTGNPRTDQLWRSVDHERLSELGITGDFVVWMPTFRRTKAVGAMRQLSETSDSEDGGPADLDVLLDGLRQRGLQLVIKPHPMDAQLRLWGGAVTITDEDLVRVGVSLYSVLGCSRGLVTDYSSVWVDYLLLDRPLAFLVPDRDSYSRALVPPDVLEWVPGELVGDDQPFATFLADLDADGRAGSVLRAEVSTRIGLNASRTAADDLIDALEKLGVLTAQRDGAAARPR